MKLKISEMLTLPREAVTQTFAILAKRGVGKTYTAAVMTEEIQHWLSELGQGSGAGRMLKAAAEVYPRTLSKDELGKLADISHSSGTFGTYLGKLRSLELITGSKEISASAEFFE